MKIVPDSKESFMERDENNGDWNMVLNNKHKIMGVTSNNNILEERKI